MISLCVGGVRHTWKAFDKGYNFSLELISIGGLHAKLWAFKLTGVPNVGILGLPLGNLETKWHLSVGHVAKHKIYYKGEGGGFPQIRALVSLVNLSLLMARPSTKVPWLCTNQLIVWFVKVRVSEWLLIILPSPILELQQAPHP